MVRNNFIFVCYFVVSTVTDFVPITTEVIIPPGVTTTSFDVTVKDDVVVEGNETFTVSFTVVDVTTGGVVTTTTGTPTVTTIVTIEDDDSKYTIHLVHSTLDYSY